jgi:hypothetical protein
LYERVARPIRIVRNILSWSHGDREKQRERAQNEKRLIQNSPVKRNAGSRNDAAPFAVLKGGRISDFSVNAAETQQNRAMS